jgi:MbtH protein
LYSLLERRAKVGSFWPAYRELPLGWREAGKEELKDECLAFIGEVWIDMRPLSLRERSD